MHFTGQTLRLKHKIKNWFYILCGIMLYSLALDVFLAGNDIAAGGLSGLAVVLSSFIPVRLSLLLLIMNIPLLLSAMFINGWRYTAETIVASFLYSLAVELFSFLPTITHDPLVGAVFGGALNGLGMACLALGNGSVGGTDLITRLLVKKNPGLSLGKMSLFVDGAVVALAVIGFGNIEVALYAIITIGICSFVADRIVLGLDRGCLCMVITSCDPVEISQSLMQHLKRAVTKLDGTGMYSQQSRSVLYMAVRPQETPRVKLLLSQIDPDAFVLVLPASEVLGGNFYSPLSTQKP